MYDTVLDDSPSNVMSKKSESLGLALIVACTLQEPWKFFGYTAIVCKALLLLMPGLASITPDLNLSGPPVEKVDTLVLGTNSG